MKKFLLMMLCLSVFTGCSRDDKKDDNNSNTSYQETNQLSDVSDQWMSRFETELKNNKVKYTERNSLDASTVGGLKGYRYKIDDGYIDIYQFEDNDDLKRIAKEKKIKLNDKEYKVEVNDHYVIVSDNLSEDILDIFRRIK